MLFIRGCRNCNRVKLLNMSYMVIADYECPYTKHIISRCDYFSLKADAVTFIENMKKHKNTYFCISLYELAYIDTDGNRYRRLKVWTKRT